MPDAISVIHLDDARSWRGGQHQAALLAEGLARSGVRQVAATPPDSPLARRMKESGIETAEMDFRGELDLKTPRALAELAIERNADILHAHTAHAHTLGLRAKKAIDRRRKDRPIRLVVTRRVDFAVGRGFFSGRKYRHADQTFIAISRAVHDALIEGGVSPERIEIVPSGVPPLPEKTLLGREDSRREFGIAADDIALLNVGALTDHKGHRWLIEAIPCVLKTHPRAHFWILGEGELRGELEALARELKIEQNLHMPGHVENARLKLAGFDFYVSSSHLEGMGTANLDAMLAGLPIVAAAAGGVTDIVVDGQTGVLTRPRDAEALAEGILRAIEMPEEVRDAMTAAARRNVEVNFSAERMVEGNLEVYRRLCGKMA